MRVLRGIWSSFNAAEKRNITLYIAGIMMYKFGLEFFNGSITTLATDRFTSTNAFTKLGVALGINQAAQCVGAILIAPLIKRWPTRTVLASAIFLFALMTAILLIVDASTGGKIKPSTVQTPIYGRWNPNLLFVVWTLSGISYGMVELIRRVIPADIVGGDVLKLRRMDATVHIFYEITGTIGAISSSLAITRFGNNYSFFMTPVFFVLAGCIWLVIGKLGFKGRRALQEEFESSGLTYVNRNSHLTYIVDVGYGIVGFVDSIWLGAKLSLLNRRFFWLFPSYAVALYLHRFLENSLAPAFAKRVLGESQWGQILVGGSNFGELLGAFSVLLLSDVVTSPLPWLRIDAIALNLVWVLPAFAKRAGKDVSWAWRVAGCFIPISYGWAAGDVSLAAYIQSVLSDSEFSHENVSYLGAVMAFLYSSYIIMNAVLSSVLGDVIDHDFSAHGNILYALQMVGGVQFSVACVIILTSTFMPKGAFALNPNVIGKERVRQSSLESQRNSGNNSDIMEADRENEKVEGSVRVFICILVLVPRPALLILIYFMSALLIRGCKFGVDLTDIRRQICIPIFHPPHSLHTVGLVTASTIGTRRCSTIGSLFNPPSPQTEPSVPSLDPFPDSTPDSCNSRTPQRRSTIILREQYIYLLLSSSAPFWFLRDLFRRHGTSHLLSPRRTPSSQSQVGVLTITSICVHPNVPVPEWQKHLPGCGKNGGNRVIFRERLNDVSLKSVCISCRS